MGKPATVTRLRGLRLAFWAWGSCALLLAAAEPGPLTLPAEGELLAGFRNPPTEARTRLYWRIFGPAWAQEEIDYQLELIKDAGVGGVTAFFMYPLATDGGGLHNQPFLSKEFLTTLGHAAAKAHELGLRFGVAGGTGWPFGGPSVSPGDAAQQVREVTVQTSSPGEGIALPTLRPGEQILAVFSGTNDITGRVLTRPFTPSASEAGKPLRLFVAGPTRMQVKRAALGGEGLVLDHYQTGAAERYLNAVVAPMLHAAPERIEWIFCDSLEVYRANWTAEFPARFLQKRGYPLLPALPEIFDSTSPRSPDARFDFWRTLSELTEAEFTRTISDWSHRQGIQLEMEAYGTPPNPLTAARYIDVPTGEQYEWRGFSLSRLAASGAHLAGRRVIGAEAWTWLGLPNRLGDSLSDVKLCSDLHFLAGANDLTGVDFAYSPRSAGKPGWLPYYGPVFNQNNPQWPWFNHLVAYTSRCQWLLRQGRPVADVALYLPVEDKFAFGSSEQMPLGFELRDHFVSGPKTDEFGLQTALHHRSDLIENLFADGLNYDGIDFFTLTRFARVSEGHLRAGDGDYRVLVLPRIIGVELEALQKIVTFCRSGGTVLVTGRLPERTFGSQRLTSARDSHVLFAELFGEEPAADRAWTRECGRGRVLFLPDEKDSLRAALREFPPDVLLEPTQTDVGFVHRQAGPLDLYFLANTADRPYSCQATFRTSQRVAEAWNPLTGEIHGLAISEAATGHRRVKLALPSRGSIFVVFGRQSATQPEPELRWQTEEMPVVWNLVFNETNAPAPRSVQELVSWTRWPEAQFYSGSATNTGQFVWNHPSPRRAFLVFSKICEVAAVTINGEAAGVAWTPPYEVELTRWLKPGPNSLAITVANSPLNLFLGTPDQDLTSLRATYGDRFPAPMEKSLHFKPSPSGLIGPVRLRFVLE